MIPCRLYLGRAVKQELVLNSPLLVAAGALGYGPYGELLSLEVVGAIVTPPLTWRAVPPSEGGRLARTPAGFLLHTGRANPGLRAALKRHGAAWRRAGPPVVIALYARTADDVFALAQQLATVAWLQGVELHLPHELPAEACAEHIALLRAETGLPCLVRLPLARVAELAPVAVAAGADALVLADPPFGRARQADGQWLYGPLHSPALAPLYTQLLYDNARRVEVPVLARGGLAAAHNVLERLAAGASAVQLDSILWRDPAALGAIYAALERDVTQRGAADWEGYLVALRSGAEAR